MPAFSDEKIGDGEGEGRGEKVIVHRCYHGGQVTERGTDAREKARRLSSFLIAISNTFARRLMRHAEKFGHIAGDVPPRARRDSAATGERNDRGGEGEASI